MQVLRNLIQIYYKTKINADKKRVCTYASSPPSMFKISPIIINNVFNYLTFISCSLQTKSVLKYARSIGEGENHADIEVVFSLPTHLSEQTLVK